MDAVQLLQRRLEREKQARKAAELFIEDKSLELYIEQKKREQAFQALQQQSAAARAVNEQLQQEIGRRIQAEALEKLLERIMQGQPLHAILAELAHLVEQHATGGRCFITTGVGQQLFHADMAPTSEPASLAAAQTSPLNKQVQFIEDVSQDPVWRPHWRAGTLKGLRGGWSVPLITADGLRVGDFAIHHPECHAPTAADVEWMLMLSELATLAIGHRWLTDSLAHQAHHDALTNLPNRLLFRERLEHAIVQARRDDAHVGVLFLDLDGFKLINDTLGHRQGDQVLIEVTRRIKALLRQNDTLARMGGDEFLIVLPSLKTPRHAARVAQKCLEALRDPMHLDGHEIYVSSSIGISVFPEDGQDTEQLQRQADLAMYQAKARGKNGFEFFTHDMTTESIQWLDLRSDLHHALGAGQFILHYQPQFHADRSVAGVEALLRWQHPTLGLLPPDRFIPIAEECGLILPIGTWVLREACRQMEAWRQAGHAGLRIAVNVSVIQLENRDWLDTVAQVLRETGLPPALLELELTENLLMNDLPRSAARLGQLRGLGVHLAIDDFGTGYSSLGCLQQLPVDTLKIDRTFVHEIDRGGVTSTSCPIVRTIVELGRSLGLRLIAEGVETERQAEFLLSLGCGVMQGHLFSPAVPAARCEQLLQRRHSISLSDKAWA